MRSGTRHKCQLYPFIFNDDRLCPKKKKNAEMAGCEAQLLAVSRGPNRREVVSDVMYNFVRSQWRSQGETNMLHFPHTPSSRDGLTSCLHGDEASLPLSFHQGSAFHVAGVLEISSETPLH